MKRNSIAALSGVCLFGGLLAAFTFVAATYYSLPATDGAHGAGLTTLLRDPFVLSVAIPCCLAVSLVALPVVYWSLRAKRLNIVAPLTIVAPTLSVGLFTPFMGILSVPISLVVLIAVLVYARNNEAWNLLENGNNA
jgi:hypothetical protein